MKKSEAAKKILDLVASEVKQVRGQLMQAEIELAKAEAVLAVRQRYSSDDPFDFTRNSEIDASFSERVANARSRLESIEQVHEIALSTFLSMIDEGEST